MHRRFGSFVQAAVATLALCVALGGCGDSKEDSSRSTDTVDPTADIVGKWALDKVVVDNAERPIVAGTSPTFTIDKSGKIGIDTGCNQIGGKVTITSSTLTVDGALSTTEMGCDADRTAQQAMFDRLFTDKVNYTRFGDLLTFTAHGLLVQFVPPSKPKVAKLEGTVWQFAGSTDAPGVAGVAASPVAGTLATLVITGNRFAGSTGCNSISGGVDVTGEGFHITDLAQTKTVCAEFASQEATIISVLRDASRAQITDKTLVITAADGRTISYTETS